MEKVQVKAGIFQAVGDTQEVQEMCLQYQDQEETDIGTQNDLMDPDPSIRGSLPDATTNTSEVSFALNHCLYILKLSHRSLDTTECWINHISNSPLV